jgi:glycosyltransferase involved in cell wall biosynthesis
MNIIAFPHRPPSIGGPGSFQTRFEAAMRKRGWKVVYPDEPTTPEVVVVVGGTVKLWWLLCCKMQGARIVLRLGGIDWQHRVVWGGLKHWLRVELTNLFVRVIRKWFADVVIYQSQFVQDWWARTYGPSEIPSHVIYNGVDLEEYSPKRMQEKAAGSDEVICLEGNISGELAVHFLNAVRQWPVSVYGNIWADVREAVDERVRPNVSLLGAIPCDAVPKIFRGRKVLLNLDTNAACPNAVIEALASGTPVVGYDTGSLSELVGTDGGRLIPYGADAWKLEMPNLEALEPAIAEVFNSYEHYSRGARLRAEKLFGLDEMVDKYIGVIESVR